MKVTTFRSVFIYQLTSDLPPSVILEKFANGMLLQQEQERVRQLERDLRIERITNKALLAFLAITAFFAISMCLKAQAVPPIPILPPGTGKIHF